MNTHRTSTFQARLAAIGLLAVAALLLGGRGNGPAAKAADGPTNLWLAYIASAPAAPTDQVPEFSHIFTIVMENTGYAELAQSAKAPFIQSLIGRYGVADSFYAVQHISLPNYLALIGGDTFGIDTNCTKCTAAGTTLVDQMEGAGISWKAYMESMPQACFVGDKGSLYQQKHNPFIYFDNIRTNPARCAKIVPFTEFATDLQANTLPRYVWITPNMCNDMHDCSVKTGDTWLQTWVTRIVASPAWQDGGALFITFDEGDLADDSGCCGYAVGGRVLTLVISPLGRPGYHSPVPYSHYSLLRTIEDAWKLPPLAKAGCTCSPPMSDFFAAATTVH